MGIVPVSSLAPSLLHVQGHLIASVQIVFLWIAKQTVNILPTRAINRDATVWANRKFTYIIFILVISIVAILPPNLHMLSNPQDICHHRPHKSYCPLGIRKLITLWAELGLPNERVSNRQDR